MLGIENIGIESNNFCLRCEATTIIISRLIFANGGDKIIVIPFSMIECQTSLASPASCRSAILETDANRAQQLAEQRRRT